MNVFDLLVLFGSSFLCALPRDRPTSWLLKVKHGGISEVKGSILKSINPAPRWKTPETGALTVDVTCLLLVLKYREGYCCTGVMVLFCRPGSSLLPLLEAVSVTRWLPVLADKAEGRRKVCYLCSRDRPGA